MSPVEQNRHRIAAAYAMLAKSYNQIFSRNTLLHMARELEHIPSEEVQAAMAQVRTRITGRLPSPVEILEELGANEAPPEEQANEVAAVIWESIGRDGYTNPERARKRMGEVGWHIVERMGGWQQLCQKVTYEERGTFFAQCRSLAAARLAQEARALSAARRLPAAQALAAC